MDLRSLHLLTAVAATCLPATLLGAAPEDAAGLAKVLAQPIIGPALAMSEVQDWTEARVPLMPELTSAEAWTQTAEQLRRRTLDDVVFRGEAARWREAKTRTQWQGELDGGPGYKIRKLRFEAFPGLWVPALLYEPTELSGAVPVVLNVNGHDRKGKAADYKQLRCINQAKRGMLALNVEWLGMGQLATAGFRHYRMNQLDLCGTSGLAPFYLSMQRGLDVLLAHPHADPDRVAVAGLSGGGWQTIVISALDTRVTLSNPVAGYSSFRTRARYLSDLGDSEQTPSDLATVVDYTHLTAMRAPRPTLLTFNEQDNCCFRPAHAQAPLWDAARPAFALYGKADALRTHVNVDPGNHNFGLDNRQALYRMFADFFFADQDGVVRQEIPSQEELKTTDQLGVELPADNADFHTLAVALLEELPREQSLPTESAAAKAWQAAARQQLAGLVKSKSYAVQARAMKQFKEGDVKVTLWQLRLGDAWTVPAVELVPGESQGTTIVVADEGRQSTAATCARLLAAGQSVLAVDPFYFGESKIEKRDFLFALLVAAVGERPLGLQASQVAGIARWADQQNGKLPVSVTAVGPRSSLFALVAAGLEPESIAEVELHSAMGSLKEIVEQDQSVDQAPELFCFGLLEQFDLVQLSALIAPRPLRYPQASQRVVQEMAPLGTFYELLGGKFSGGD